MAASKVLTRKIQKAMSNFQNGIPDLEFNDITCKEKLQYNFPNGTSLKIEDPIYMATLPSGENLVYDANEVSYKIRPSIGWSKTWTTREGCDNFVPEDISAQKQTGVQAINS